MVQFYGFEETGDIDKLVKIRYVCSWISCIMCCFTLIMYFILLIRNSFNTQERRSKSLDSNSKSSKSSKKRFGLGSHAMAVLILLNLIWSIVNIISGYYYPKGFVYELDKFFTPCEYFAFLHHFLDLSQIGWTSVISSLFLSSTKSRMITSEEGKDIILNGFFIYTSVPLIMTGIPLLTYSYGPSGQFCSFDVINPDANFYIWFVIFQLYSWYFIFFNVYAIIRVIIFYMQKLRLVKNHNKIEYNNMKIYVFLFGFFPLFLFLTRIFGFIHSIILISSQDEIYWLSATSGSLFALSGSLNSILCMFFYRKAFFCECIKSERNLSFSQKSIPKMQEMKESMNSHPSALGINEE